MYTRWSNIHYNIIFRQSGLYSGIVRFGIAEAIRLIEHSLDQLRARLGHPLLATHLATIYNMELSCPSLEHPRGNLQTESL